MAGSFFPNEWWKLAKPDYEKSVMALKALTVKDLEPGTKDVSTRKRLRIRGNPCKGAGLPPGSGCRALQGLVCRQTREKVTGCLEFRGDEIGLPPCEIGRAHV